MSAAPNHPEEDKLSYSFPKEERLRSKKLIAELFRNGSSFNMYPLRFVFLKSDSNSSQFPQILISVSKKYFKKAVDRNRIKRQIREAYRLNKHQLLLSGTCKIQVLGVIYIGKEKTSFQVIQKKLNLGLERSLTN